METNDFFIERDEDDKSKSVKKDQEPKTTMFEKNKKGKFEEPKTTVFSSTPSAKPTNKPTYEFNAPTEIITPKHSQNTPIEKAAPEKNKETSNDNAPQRPIFNSGRISNRIKDGGSKGIVTGFLVSFSRDPNGEFWALRQGKNTIGSDRTNSIILQDRNISDQHAVLNIRRSRKDNRLMFAIVDMCSEEGTLVNNEDIEFTTTELSTGDKIIIGGYELLMLSFDKDKQDLNSNNSEGSDSESSSTGWKDID